MTVIASPPPAISFATQLIDCRPDLPARTDENDIRLADRIADGDEEALRDLYDQYSRPVFTLLLRRLGDRTAAEDVQQQVFTEVWQKASRFDPKRGSILAWIMAIARSRAIDHGRKRVPEPKDPVRAAELAGHDSGRGEIESFIDSFQFTQLLQEIPAEEAELIRFRFHNELSQREISDKTGIPLGTVKSRMVSGLGRLRALMEAET